MHPDELTHYAKQAYSVSTKLLLAGKSGGLSTGGSWDLSRHSRYGGRSLGYIGRNEGALYSLDCGDFQAV